MIDTHKYVIRYQIDHKQLGKQCDFLANGVNLIDRQET